MYTGLLIRDLISQVERAELRAQLRAELRAALSAEQTRAAEERELDRIYALQVPVTEADQILMGAA
jgi:hypothetical protein